MTPLASAPRRTALTVAMLAAARTAAAALLRAAPAAAASTDACVTPEACDLDKDGNTRPAARLRVQAWDRDDVSDDLLATGRTGADGSYSLCSDNDDGIGNIGRDVDVKVHHRERPVAGARARRSGVRDHRPGPRRRDRRQHHPARYHPAGSSLMRAWHA